MSMKAVARRVLGVLPGVTEAGLPAGLSGPPSLKAPRLPPLA